MDANTGKNNGTQWAYSQGQLVKVKTAFTTHVYYSGDKQVSLPAGSLIVLGFQQKLTGLFNDWTIVSAMTPDGASIAVQDVYLLDSDLQQYCEPYNLTLLNQPIEHPEMLQVGDSIFVHSSFLSQSIEAQVPVGTIVVLGERDVALQSWMVCVATDGNGGSVALAQHLLFDFELFKYCSKVSF